MSGKVLCVVCINNIAEYTFIPCGHLCICKNCKDVQLKTNKICPVCRCNYNSIIKIFVAGQVITDDYDDIVDKLRNIDALENKTEDILNEQKTLIIQLEQIIKEKEELEKSKKKIIDVSEEQTKINLEQLRLEQEKITQITKEIEEKRQKQIEFIKSEQDRIKKINENTKNTTEYIEKKLLDELHELDRIKAERNRIEQQKQRELEQQKQNLQQIRNQITEINQPILHNSNTDIELAINKIFLSGDSSQINTKNLETAKKKLNNKKIKIYDRSISDDFVVNKSINFFRIKKNGNIQMNAKNIISKATQDTFILDNNEEISKNDTLFIHV